MMRTLLKLPLLAGSFSYAFPRGELAFTINKLYWVDESINTTSNLRGLGVISSNAVWVAGSSGSVFRGDGSLRWTDISPSEAKVLGLEFRDIHAFSVNRSFILSIGEGNKSRIYGTDNGGLSWRPTFVNQDPSAFYDCLAFDSPSHGMAVSDPVNGTFKLIETNNGGFTFEPVKNYRMPAALEGEAGFAASGSCLTTTAGRWYLATGGVSPSRIFYSQDGINWDVSPTPIQAGTSAGVFSVQFRNSTHGIAVGGDYRQPDGPGISSAWTTNGGLSWHASGYSPGEYRSSVSWIPQAVFPPGDAVAVGPTGSDITRDGGKTWHKFDNSSFDTVDCVSGVSFAWSCWASGQRGRVGRLFFDYK
jgi:photosystem II stability/assembly factor-like uncharacterized protein